MASARPLTTAFGGLVLPVEGQDLDRVAPALSLPRRQVLLLLDGARLHRDGLPARVVGIAALMVSKLAGCHSVSTPSFPATALNTSTSMPCTVLPSAARNSFGRSSGPYRSRWRLSP